MTDIGRAGMVMKGDYNSASTYEVLDVVSYNYGLYVAKQNVPVNTPPNNTTYWQAAIVNRPRTYINVAQSIAEAPTTLSNICKIATIPANSVYQIEARLLYDYAEPKEIGITYISEYISPYVSLARSTEHLVVTICGMTDSLPMDLYLWGRWDAANRNGYQIRGFYEPQ